MSDTAPTKTISDFEAKLSEADKSVASFDQDDDGLVQKVRGYLRSNPTAIPAIILISSVLVFGIISLIQPNNFLTAGTLSLILKQVTVVGIIAIAQTLVILTAGIDLSVGIILVLCAMIMGRLTTLHDVPYYFAIPVALAAGTAMGAINGFLVTKARIPPLIVTLGTYYAFRALNLWYTGSESVRPAALNEKAPELLVFGTAFNIGTANFILGSFALIALAVLAWYMLNRTAWGRHVTAVGDDPDAAMLSGVQIDRTLISVYALAGLICAFGAWVALGRVGSMSPIAFETVNLDSITAVVIGGTSLFGGRASIAGSVLGAIIVGVFFTGLALVGVESYWQWFAMGCLLIGAVAIDQWLRRASQ
ncbi:MAG: ABC transporter permease [Phyllobacteriaceae bacterium]|nr:ABC transporter permease [Phyllobacteriaceae bacterium]